MKIYAPDYYRAFRCIASDCRHSCCVGWEIDIDGDTYEYYSSIKGKFGEKLQKNIACDECVHFILGDNERCPFLNKENLCDIIINLGEESLCQICADHPRYRNFYSDREEIGIGLACEEAARLIVESRGTVKITELSDDGEECVLCDEDAEFLKYRSAIFDLLQNRSLSIESRLDKCTEMCGVQTDDGTVMGICEGFYGLEYMEEEWHTALEGLRKNEKLLPVPPEFDTAFEQLAVYFVYRHLADGIEDGNIDKRLAFCVLSTKMIRLLCSLHLAETGELTYSDIAQAARMYSAEIEYSEDNVRALIESL